MHDNIKFILRDEDIQVWWGQLVFRFILGVGVRAFLHVLGWQIQKKLPPLRILSGTDINELVNQTHYQVF